MKLEHQIASNPAPDVAHAMRLSSRVVDLGVGSDSLAERLDGSRKREYCHVVCIDVGLIAGAWLQCCHMRVQLAEERRRALEQSAHMDRRGRVYRFFVD